MSTIADPPLVLRRRRIIAPAAVSLPARPDIIVVENRQSREIEWKALVFGPSIDSAGLLWSLSSSWAFARWRWNRPNSSAPPGPGKQLCAQFGHPLIPQTTR